MVSVPFAWAAIGLVNAALALAIVVDVERSDRGFYLVWAMLLGALLLAILGLEVNP